MDEEYCRRSVDSAAKRRLFLNANEERFKTFILERLDDFIKNLKSSLDVFCIFVDLVSKNDFPLDSIAWPHSCLKKVVVSLPNQQTAYNISHPCSSSTAHSEQVHPYQAIDKLGTSHP